MHAFFGALSRSFGDVARVSESYRVVRSLSVLTWFATPASKVAPRRVGDQVMHRLVRRAHLVRLHPRRHRLDTLAFALAASGS